MRSQFQCWGTAVSELPRPFPFLKTYHLSAQNVPLGEQRGLSASSTLVFIYFYLFLSSKLPFRKSCRIYFAFSSLSFRTSSTFTLSFILSILCATVIPHFMTFYACRSDRLCRGVAFIGAVSLKLNAPEWAAVTRSLTDLVVALRAL